MSARVAALEVKRAHLLERAAREREDLAHALLSWSKPLGLVDRCIDGIRFVAARPPLVAAAAMAFVLLRPRRALRWARRGFALWQGYRWLTNKIAV